MCQKPTNLQSYLRYTYILIMLSRGDELQSKYHFLYTMRLSNILPFWDISTIQKTCNGVIMQHQGHHNSHAI